MPGHHIIHSELRMVRKKGTWNGKKGPYQPPYTLSPAILKLVAEIGEIIGRYSATSKIRLTPQRVNHLRFDRIGVGTCVHCNAKDIPQATR